MQFELPEDDGPVAFAAAPGNRLSVLAAMKAKILAGIEARLHEYKTDGLTLPSKDAFLASVKSFAESTLAMIDVPVLGPVTEAAAKKVLVAGILELAGLLYDGFAS